MAHLDPGTDSGGQELRDLRYRNLFERVSDGFALVQAIRDKEGHLLDYLVLEANPALHRILDPAGPMVGRRQSEIIPNAPPAWLAACEAAFNGRTVNFEYHAPGSRRWFDIHLSRIGPDQISQLVVDITERKHAEARQSEMFDELNHRVKNNLAVVSAILAMQSRTAASPDVREHLTKAIDRIQTLAAVHASLYRSGRKDDVDVAAYVRDLCRRLENSVLDKDRVKLEVRVTPAILPLDQAVALGLVVNELVTNAAKHAFPAPECGIVSVELLPDGASLKLRVSDGGPGLPAEPNESGLGMRLVRSLVQQLGGDLSIVQQPGATFIVSLPVRGGPPDVLHTRLS